MGRPAEALRTLLALALFLCAATLAAPAGQLENSGNADVEVVAVSDGDTFHVMHRGMRVRMRLAEIDAPEKAQAFGRRAEQALRDLVWKRVVRVRWTSLDRYGRPIVHVVADGIDVNARLVETGMAWHYLKYSRSGTLARLEADARRRHVGLWAEKNPIAPWQWRKARHVDE